MNPREILEKRDSILKEADAIVAQAEKEGRNISEEERSKIDEALRQADAMKGDAERVERLAGVRSKSDQVSREIGMSDADVKQYSFLRAIDAAAEAARGNPDAWKRAGLELEASRTLAAKLGREPRGFFVPVDVTGKRDLNPDTGSAGGYLKATDLLGASFVDLLRNKMVLQSAGATILGGLVGDVAIAKQSAGATAYWVATSGSPTESQQTIGQILLQPKTVGAYTDISRKLMKQSSIDAESFVRNDLTKVLAVAIDLAGLHGTGADNQPTGIAATSGIGSVAGGTDGLAPAWSHIVKLETEVAQDNADIGSLAYITNAKVRGKLKVTPKTATYGDIMVWGEGPTPLNGYKALVTNQVSSTLTKGSSTGVGVCSAIFFGNWADLLIGMWGGLDVLVDPYTGSASGTVRVTAFQDVDIAVRHPESFAAMLDALTA